MSSISSTRNADQRPSLSQFQYQYLGGSSASVMDTTVRPEVALRRVNKACCSCRRDKIRCDGTRPCSGCLKKGLAPEKCIDGCFQCRRARTRCDGAHPCLTCVELQIDCTEETASPSYNRADVHVKAEGNTRKLKSTDRAKLACFACRRDNKKCDDERPCKRCKTRSEECVHIERGPKVVKTRCKRCREENQKCEDRRPCKNCEDAGEHCSDIPRKGRGYGQRVKAACMHCRRDKIQCETERPCRGCVRRGLQCLDRTCACAEKGRGHECSICRAQRAQGESSIHNYLAPSGQPDFPNPTEPALLSQPQASLPVDHKPSFPPQNATASQPQSSSSSSLLEALTSLPVGSFPPNTTSAQSNPGALPRYNASASVTRNLLPSYGPISGVRNDPYSESTGTMPFYNPMSMLISAMDLQRSFTAGSRDLQQLYMPMIDPNIERSSQT